ncbi:MAG: XRE family transcriptional regulator [Alphaproteobacteria bacterium]|nr:helix-turn-helix transcriptional regulator [Alphaproteobacteria bacterium]TAD87055.1 MAG: XRE family transcriptional regulator [Alphaproteobacteria bacterium]
MYTHPQHKAGEDGRRLRREAGQWLRDLRTARGLTQRQLADQVGVAYYTFVSQIEAGKGRVPPESYQVWADALGLPVADFVRTLLAYYDPFTHRALFGAVEPLVPPSPER